MHQNSDVAYFLHGAGITEWMWEPCLPTLPGWTFETPRLPVFAKGFSIEQAAKQVIVQIEQQHPGCKVHLVGHSLGGAVALHMLALRPDLLRSVLVSGTLALPMPGMGAMIQMTKWMLPLTQRPFMLRLSAKAIKVPEKHFAAFCQDQRAATRETLHEVMWAAARFRLPAALKDVQVPVLAVAGSREVRATLDTLQALKHHLPGSQTRTIPGGSHVWFAEQPEVWHSLLIEWLSRHQPKLSATQRA